MAKGGSSIFLSLIVIFLLSFVIIVGLRAIVIATVGPIPDYNTVNSFWDHAWYAFLQMTDPGNMYQDSMTSGWIRVVTVISGFVGVIIFSALIAFLTTALDNILLNFRKGQGKIIEKGHTLILGWNDRVVDILAELVIANESEKDSCVVILADRDKDFMDAVLAKRLDNRGSTRVIATTGEHSNLKELRRVSANQAKSIIVLANCDDNATTEHQLQSDTDVIKVVLAMLAVQEGANKVPIVCEVFTKQKRDVIGFFNDEKIIAIDSWDIMGKLFVQTSLTSGLEMVYNEILSFDRSEIYFYGSDWNNCLFGDLSYHFKDGIALGVFSKEGKLSLRPGRNRRMEEGDEILILANDDSTIEFSKKRLYDPINLKFNELRLEKKRKKILVLGWHRIGALFLKECSEYLAAGSEFVICLNSLSPKIDSNINNIRKEFPSLDISVLEKDVMSLEALRHISPYSYDTVLILAQKPDNIVPKRVDADTLLLLLLLREIGGEQSIENQEKTKIITQVLDSENQDLILQTDVDDFIISNKLITMVLAQMSEEPRIKKLYDDIFSEEGSEIYVKPAYLYFESFPVKIPFATIMNQVQKREEICLGVRYAHLSKSSKDNFGVFLNPVKDDVIELSENDFLVVLSEDEL